MLTTKQKEGSERKEQSTEPPNQSINQSKSNLSSFHFHTIMIWFIWMDHPFTYCKVRDESDWSTWPMPLITISLHRLQWNYLLNQNINTSTHQNIKSVIPLIDWLTGQQLPINRKFYLASIHFISFQTRIFIWMEIHLQLRLSWVKFVNPIIAGTSNWTPLSPMRLPAQSLIGRGTTSTHQISNQ